MNKKMLKYHETRSAGLSSDQLLDAVMECAGDFRILVEMNTMNPKYNKGLMVQEGDSYTVLEIYRDELLRRLEKRAE